MRRGLGGGLFSLMGRGGGFIVRGGEGGFGVLSAWLEDGFGEAGFVGVAAGFDVAGIVVADLGLPVGEETAGFGGAER